MELARVIVVGRQRVLLGSFHEHTILKRPHVKSEGRKWQKMGAMRERCLRNMLRVLLLLLLLLLSLLLLLLLPLRLLQQC